ncbi:MAG: PadR family transcriptional regulator [Actinomycetota bacterium]|nr:PadR family transcriptional regulator [Actinomycetota bacterium]
MPIQHAVLALLDEGPSYGYELKSHFEQAIGPQWGDLNIGHLYQVLERLVREGSIKRREVAQSNRPDKAVYRLTAAGRRELDLWLDTPFVRQSGYRDDFFLKLFAAARLGVERLQRVVAIQRQAYLAELAALAALRSKLDHEALIAVLIDAALLHTEANLKTLEVVESDIDSLSGAAFSKASATSTQQVPAPEQTASSFSSA